MGVPGAVGAILYATVSPPAAAGPSEVSGVLVSNGTEIELPYVNVWAEEEGFIKPTDPTWRILFVEHEIAPKDLGEPIRVAWVKIGITETSEFGDAPELHIYLH
jgi:hypothetical protein